MKRLFVFITLLTLFLSTPALAQEPVAGEPFTPPELKRGEPWTPPPVATVLAVEDGPCDYLPRWVDNSGDNDVMPPGFPTTGNVADILEWTGLEVDRRYGCERARAGETYLSLEALELKCGPATVIARADQGGQTLDGVLLFMNWPNMGDANMFPPEGVNPPYFSQGVGGFTDGGGAVGWGYGGGSFITPGIGGPFSVWGSACTDLGCRYGVWVGSDALLRTGWFGGTVHCTINPWFEPRVKSGGGSTPPPPIPTDDAWLGVFEQGQLLYYIPLIRGMPSGNTDTFNGLGYIGPDGAWLWYVPGIEGAVPGSTP